MGGSGDLDFIGQIFRQAPLVLFAPFVFGALYVASMVIVFRRAAARRRRAREARDLMGETKGFSPTEKSKPKLREPERAPQTVALPEPDLDLLTMGIASKPRSAPPVPAPPLPSLIPDDLPTYPPLEVLSEPVIEVIDADMAEEVTDAVEVMRVWRDVNDGSLIIQMGSQRYRSAAEIRNPDLLRRFSAVVRDLWNMINGQANPTIPPPPQAVRLPADTGSIGNLRASEAEPKKPGGLKKLVQQVSGAPKTTADKPKGIAEAVEEFLQYKLLGSPEFSVHSIHIRPGLDHGLRIEVDGHFYDSIGEVVDVDVREFLFAMMREWEARQ